MADAIAIAPELPFRNQALEFIQHLSKSLPNPNDVASAKELLSQFDGQLKADDGVPDVSPENRKAAVKAMVAKVVELRGALEGVKDTDAEASHLLLQYLLSENFEQNSKEHIELVRTVVEAVKKGGEVAWTSKRINRHETACRVLNNTYNYLPSSSPLRPTVLLSLISLLAISSDLKSLPLSRSLLTQSLSQWSVSPEEKLSFVQSASQIYASSRDSHKAVELQLIALEQLSAGDAAVEKTLVYALADPKRFTLDQIVSLPAVQGKVTGKAKEVVDLFEGSDPIEAVKRGQSWVESNKSWFEGFGVAQFTGEALLRKLRYIALVHLASQSSTQQLSYSEVAQALSVEETDVEVWVIDAVRESLLKARLSQPTSSIRILSVSSIGTRQFGSSEWQLLESRLQEWKKAVGDVRKVVEDAETLASQGPITHRSGRQGQSQRQEQGRDGRDGQQQQQQREEVAA